MTSLNYRARAELFLGSDHTTAMALGARSFATAAQALHFAFEEAAPVSLRGAMLAVEGRTYRGEALDALYRSPSFPLPRRGEINRSRQRRARNRRLAAFKAAFQLPAAQSTAWA